MGIQHARKLGSISAALVLSLCALFGSSTAAAQELHGFNVQDQDPANALRTLGAQGGIQVLASAADLAGVKLNAVSGTMSTPQALRSLLAGTGLEFRYVGDTAVAVVPSAPVRRVRVSAAIDATAAATAASQGTAAQAAPAEPGQLQEIIVTATRRAEDISKVPISITAVTQGTIDALGIKDFTDVAKYTPGVNIDTDRTNQISVRGITAASGTADTTAIYIDDTPVQSRSDIDALPQAFDVQRIEVLRGPQGTLFGAGAEGGAVRYITVQPSVTKSDLYSRDEISYTQGGAANYSIGVAGGGPAIDNVLGFRATALWTHQGGWIDRVDSEAPAMMAGNPSQPLASNYILDSNANRLTEKMLRLAALWQPTEGWQITPGIYYQNKQQNDETIYWPIFSNPSKNIYYNGNPERVPYNDHFYLYTLKVQGNLGFADFISNSSYFDRYTSASYGAQTGTTYNLGFFQDLAQGANGAPNATTWVPGLPWQDATGIHLPAGLRYYAPAPTLSWFYNWTQEFRLQSNDTASKFQWTAGLFYLFDQQLDQNWIYGDDDAALWASQGLTIEDIFGIGNLSNPNASWYTWENQYTRQYAVYADASYAFTDQWKLDIGLRESKIIYTFAEYIAGSQWFAPGSASYGQNKQPSFTPKASINFQATPNDLYYFTYARGFRSGGANAPIPEVACAEDFGNLGITGTPLTYNSDTTDSFEVGAKNNVANRLQLATSVYWIKWNAIQQFAYLPICGLGFVENLGQAVSKGFDLSGNWRVTDSFTIDLAVGFNEARYTADSKLSPTVSAPIVASGDSINGANGQPVPPWSGTLGLEYRFNAFSKQAFIRADDQYVSAPKWLSAQFDSRTALYYPSDYPLPSLNQVNLRLGVTIGLWEVDAFVNNLANSHPVTTYGFSPPGFAGLGNARFNSLETDSTVIPRTMGFTFIFHK